MRRPGPDEWMTLLAEYESSGLQQKEFVEKHQLSLSDEAIAQVLDRGSMEDWRALYSLAKSDSRLRARIISTVARVPMYLPHFWLVAMEALGERVDLSAVAPNDGMQE